MDQTFLMVKPDGVARGLIGEVISRIERKGLKIRDMKIVNITEELARRHYSEHVDKPFFNNLVSFITSGAVVAMIIEGEDCVKVIRKMIGVTDPIEASPGTIRGDFALSIDNNIVHASDSPESAIREIDLFFS